MEETKQIRIKEYNYDLPEERIAKFPLPQRDKSKLLLYQQGKISETLFSHLPELLPKGALLVFNNTKVIQARLHFRKETGALIEVFCLEPLDPAEYVVSFQQREQVSWSCLIGNLKKWKEGTLHRNLTVHGKELILSAVRGEDLGTSHRVTFSWDDPEITFADLLETVGELPIPPYLNRDTEESDKETYQTVYSRIKGSVAAPTAGLHFTPQVLSELDARGIERAELTLHVGAGTFKPVKSEKIAAHEMHTEWISIQRETLQQLIAHKGQAIAVGTTSVRTLESLYYMGLTLFYHPEASEEELAVRQWQPYQPHEEIEPLLALQCLMKYMERHQLKSLHSHTQILIAPGYSYHIVKAMITNFHQPQSTLLLLVSAFLKGDWKAVYDYALNHGFRFLSYGDSSLLIP